MGIAATFVPDAHVVTIFGPVSDLIGAMNGLMT